MSQAPFEPVFVVGVPRSGTTLLRAMLNRHPRIGLCDETYYFYYVNARRRAFGDLADLSNRRRLIASYSATTRVQRLGLEQEALGRRLEAEGTSYEAFLASLLRFYAESKGKARAGEKTPHHAWFTETLFEWYPGAKILHLLRDPRDVCASLFNVPWGHRSARANGRLWVGLVEAAERSRPRPGYLLIKYEDLVAEPERQLGEICRFLGESFSPVMLETEPNARADRPWFERAQGRLSGDRVAKWKEQLTEDQVRLVEWAAGPLMERFGYQRVLSPAGSGLRFRGAAHQMARDLMERVKRSPRLWYYWVRPTRLAAEEAWIDR